MSQVQSGILPEHCRAAIWIEANVKGEVDALRAASKTFAEKLAAFEAKFPDAHLGAVVAFGNNTWRALSGGVGAEELKDFPGYGKGLAPTTQFDVLIHILSLRHDVNFSVAQAAMEAFGDCIDVKEEIHGFRWVEERDLSGFVDGTENPAGEETRREVAVIKDGVDAGGSYVFVQRWEHNLKQLNRMSIHDQEMMIGRTKEDNEEIDGDTKVVQRGAADKLFINTAGMGAIPANIHWVSTLRRCCPYKSDHLTIRHRRRGSADEYFLLLP